MYNGNTLIECGEWTYLYSTYFMNCGGGGGGGGGGVPAPAQDITNHIKNDCLKKMVDTTLSKNIKTQIDSMIQNVFGESVKMNLDFVDVDTLPSYADGETQPNGGIQNGVLNVTVLLDNTRLPSYSQQYIARVIMHEALHAYLFAKGTNERLQHEDMIKNYVTGMAKSLQQMFGGLVDEDAKNLALGGLQLTQTFQDSIKKDLKLESSFDAAQLAYAIGSKGKRCN